MARGGKRIGAGRRKTSANTEQVTIYLTQKGKAKLSVIAKSKKVTKGQIVETLIGSRMPQYLEMLINGGFLSPNSLGDEDDEQIGWSLNPRIIVFLDGSIKDIYFGMDLISGLCSFSIFDDSERNYRSEWIPMPMSLKDFKKELLKLFNKAQAE